MFNSDKDKKTFQKAIEALKSSDPQKSLETINAIIGDDTPLTAQKLLTEIKKAYKILFKLQGKLLREQLQENLSDEDCNGDYKNCPECEQTYVKAAYDKRDKTVYFECNKEDLDEKYLKYTLEYMKAPKDTKVVFLGR